MSNSDLFSNGLKTAWRHMKRDRLVTILNLIGLSGGLLCALLISLWVMDELRFDKFHKTDARLFEVMIHQHHGNQILTSNGTGERIGETLLKEMPEVDMAVTTTPASWFQKFSVSTGTHVISARGNFVGPDYFKIFSFPFMQGSADQAITGKKSIVISETLARRLFPSSGQVLGQRIEWKWQTYAEQCLVTGVFKDFPANSSQQYDFLLPMDAWNQIVPKSEMVSASGPFDNFIVLKEGADAVRFNQKLDGLAKTSLSDSTSSMFLRNYADGYLHGQFEQGEQAGGRKMYVHLFTVIAIMILLIACINFMNLSTAKASVRVKEVGIKKALGAERSTLVFQFLVEVLMVSLVAMVIAIILSWFILPYFNAITGKHLSLYFDLKVAFLILAVTVLTGLLAGSYPAFYLSRSSPSPNLQGLLPSSFGTVLIRKGLVVFQFTVSVIFIISVLVVYKQMHYVTHKHLGYDKDNILYFDMDGRIATQRESFLSQLRLLPGVVNASGIQQKITLPALLPGTGGGVRWDGRNHDDKVRFHRMPVDYDLIETIGVKMVKGRSFSRKYGSEDSKVILNEVAIKAMNIVDPVGKMITISGQEREIVGVCRNFHFNSLHESIRPFILYLAPAETKLVMTKIAAGKEKATVKQIQNLYKRFNPGYAFDYQFLDDDYQRQYLAESITGTLLKYFAILAVTISCLGLLGLVAFTAERRKKEIGIRKILGATVENVVTMLTKEFFILVLLSICFGFPLAWWLMEKWLENFAYREPISVNIFINAGLLVMLITFCTITYHALQAAWVNPVKSLKAD